MKREKMIEAMKKRRGGDGGGGREILRVEGNGGGETMEAKDEDTVEMK